MSVERALLYLTMAEAAFLDAALARLIPADELGPGAKEADVTSYIDRELASAWGVHGRNYRMGPWPQGTPQQGWQSPLTPQELYRAAIRESNEHCLRERGKPFHLLSPDEQDDVLRALEGDAIALPSVPGALFFRMLWRNVEEGFFADPLHGGNQDKIGWRLIGFPGVAASGYSERMADANVPYRVEPVSIVDLQRGDAKLDAQGFAQHVPLAPRK